MNADFISAATLCVRLPRPSIYFSYFICRSKRGDSVGPRTPYNATALRRRPTLPDSPRRIGWASYGWSKRANRFIGKQRAIYRGSVSRSTPDLFIYDKLGSVSDLWFLLSQLLLTTAGCLPPSGFLHIPIRCFFFYPFSLALATIPIMNALTSINKSRPSVSRLNPIQRLQTHGFSNQSPSPISSLPLSTNSSCDASSHHEDPARSFMRWFSGVTVGSGLGFLYWSVASDSEPALSNKPLVSFAEATTESALNDRFSASAFRKLSLPDYSSKFLFGEAFRRKIFFNYEKRIRLRSPPEKVFEYFASFRTPEGELLMKPADLMRAVVPVFPPSASHLVRDGYLRGERRPGELRCAPSEFFMLFDVDNDGLISFKEYIFFVTLLSIPESSFSVAFKMFDTNNSGEIDKEEFKKVMALMRAHNRQGAVHKNGLRSGWKVNGSVENGGLVEHFFGKDGDECLQHDKFVKFLRDLQDEILRLEFAHYDYRLQGTISAKDFALSMVASADMSHLDKLLKRADELDTKAHLKDIRITFEEFKSFAELRKKLMPFSLALFSFGKVNSLLTKEDFQRAATHVCGVTLTDNVIDIIFHLFDSNYDGNLSSEEFVRVLHKRERDIAQPSESGIMGFISCCLNCADNCSIARFLS